MPLDGGENRTRAIFSDLDQHFRTPLRRILTNDEDRRRCFSHLASALAFRSVIDPNDEPICIATLLGLDFDRFQGEPTVVDVYRSLTELPREILFLSGPRLHVPGFRWASSTFMNGFSWESRSKQLFGTLDDEGFHICTDCIFLDEDFGWKFHRGSPLHFNVECLGLEDFQVFSFPDSDSDVSGLAGPSQFVVLLERSA
jgi:hypothetical protein